MSKVSKAGKLQLFQRHPESANVPLPACCFISLWFSSPFIKHRWKYSLASEQRYEPIFVHKCGKLHKDVHKHIAEKVVL